MTDVAPNRAQRRSAWPKRRQWLDRVAKDSRLTSGAKAWLMLLASRSDDQGKPVWGNQEKMADQLGRSARSVRRYLVEAVKLGYLKVFHSKPERNRSTGRFGRRKTNSHYFCLPARETAGQPAPRRRQRAPYCVVRPQAHRPSHLPDSDGRSSPSGVRQHGAAPPTNHFRDAASPETPQPIASQDVAEFYLAAARAKLRGEAAPRR